MHKDTSAEDLKPACFGKNHPVFIMLLRHHNQSDLVNIVVPNCDNPLAI